MVCSLVFCSDLEEVTLPLELDFYINKSKIE
jgi:hypothetical protein